MAGKTAWTKLGLTRPEGFSPAHNDVLRAAAAAHGKVMAAGGSKFKAEMAARDAAKSLGYGGRDASLGAKSSATLAKARDAGKVAERSAVAAPQKPAPALNAAGAKAMRDGRAKLAAARADLLKSKGAMTAAQKAAAWEQAGLSNRAVAERLNAGGGVLPGPKAAPVAVTAAPATKSGYQAQGGADAWKRYAGMADAHQAKLVADRAAGKVEPSRSIEATVAKQAPTQPKPKDAASVTERNGKPVVRVSKEDAAVAKVVNKMNQDDQALVARVLKIMGGQARNNLNAAEMGRAERLMQAAGML